MASYTATIRWQHDGNDFARGKYSRAHTWTFDGGVVVPASSSPHVVREPMSDATAVDPEEAFVAAISSCHMLTFLHVARLAGFAITAYDDEAVGTMTKNEHGTSWVSKVVLKPRITWACDPPDAAQLDALHDKAHHECFIASSVKTDIEIAKA
jgi:organic hydroperoxide reductase OsmC/OhrA